MRSEAASPQALRVIACDAPTAADLERVVTFHHEVYTREHGPDAGFDAHVRQSVADFAAGDAAGSRLWLADRAGAPVACIAILRRSAEEAQLRWFLVDPSYRGTGLGGALLNQALEFARDQGYRSVFLWTVSKLEAAAVLYARAGFVRTEANAVRLWGEELMEERYELVLARAP